MAATITVHAVPVKDFAGPAASLRTERSSNFPASGQGPEAVFIPGPRFALCISFWLTSWQISSIRRRSFLFYTKAQIVCKGPSQRID